MDDKSAFERQIAAEIDYEVGPPHPVDALAISRTAKTPTARWRIQSMLSPAKALTAGAILFAIGGVLLIAQPFDRQTSSVPGAATDAALAGEDWAFFSGTVDFDGSTGTVARQSFLDNGMSVDLGMGFGGQVMVTDDPRMNGTRTGTINLFSDRPDDSTANIGSALVTIANDDGSWTCPMTFIHHLTDKNAAGEIEQWAGWCEGSGAYQSLKAYLALRQPEDLASSGRQDVYGFITSGEGPPMPEAPAS